VKPKQERVVNTRMDSQSCNSSTRSDAGKDTVTPATVSNDQESDRSQPKLARHNHEQGAPLVDECDGWCRYKASEYERQTSGSTGTAASNESTLKNLREYQMLVEGRILSELQAYIQHNAVLPSDHVGSGSVVPLSLLRGWIQRERGRRGIQVAQHVERTEDA
jgi:hypothetical protein